MANNFRPPPPFIFYNPYPYYHGYRTPEEVYPYPVGQHQPQRSPYETNPYYQFGTPTQFHQQEYGYPSLGMTSINLGNQESSSLNHHAHLVSQQSIQQGPINTNFDTSSDETCYQHQKLNMSTTSQTRSAEKNSHEPLQQEKNQPDKKFLDEIDQLISYYDDILPKINTPGQSSHVLSTYENNFETNIILDSALHLEVDTKCEDSGQIFVEPNRTPISTSTWENGNTLSLDFHSELTPRPDRPQSPSILENSSKISVDYTSTQNNANVLSKGAVVRADKETKAIEYVMWNTLVKDRNLWCCRQCQKKIYRVGDFDMIYKHWIHTHFIERPTCPICTASKTSFIELWEHMTSFHTEDINEHTCSDYNNMIIRSKSGKKMDYFCKTCNTRFAKPDLVLLHWKRVHKRKFVRCEKCVKVFPNNTYLKHHIREKCRESITICPLGKSTSCTCFLSLNVCPTLPSELQENQTINETVSLRKNRKTKAWIRKTVGSKSLIQCIDCAKVFTLPRSAIRHWDLTHDDNPIKCETCNVEFKNPATLKSHVYSNHRTKFKLVGTDADKYAEHIALEPAYKKKFMCKHCGQRFVRRASATRHYAKSHKKPSN